MDRARIVHPGGARLGWRPRRFGKGVRMPVHRPRRGIGASLAATAMLMLGATALASPSGTAAPPPDESLARAETLHPAELYRVAAQLLGRPDRADEAVMWFYVGQLRYRFHLAATKPPAGANDRVLFSALSESVGRPVNTSAFGDVDAAVARIDAALAWDAAHDNPLTSKTAFAKEWEEVRQGLTSLRDKMLASKDEIRETRRRNGLANR